MDDPTPLTQRKCEPCEGKGTPLDINASKKQLKNIPGWTIEAGGKVISRVYTVKNFIAAIRFIEKVAAIAESENHHPDIHLTGYRKLKIDLSTHAIGGLSENDFIVAAKLNELPVELKQ